MLEPIELFWSSENLEPRSQVFFESAGLEQKILGGFLVLWKVFNDCDELNKWKSSVEIINQIKTSGFIQGIATSFSKSAWNSA